MVFNALEFLRCKLRNVIDSAAELLTCHGDDGCHGTTRSLPIFLVQNGE